MTIIFSIRRVCGVYQAQWYFIRKMAWFDCSYLDAFLCSVVCIKHGDTLYGRRLDLIVLIWIRSCIPSINDLPVSPFTISCDDRTFLVSAQHKWSNLPSGWKIVITLKRIFEPQLFRVAFHQGLASLTQNLHMQCFYLITLTYIKCLSHTTHLFYQMITNRN